MIPIIFLVSISHSLCLLSLFLSLYISLPLRLSVCLSLCLSVCLSLSVSLCLSVYVSLHLSLCVSVCLSFQVSLDNTHWMKCILLGAMSLTVGGIMRFIPCEDSESDFAPVSPLITMKASVRR